MPARNRAERRAAPTAKVDAAAPVAGQGHPDYPGEYTLTGTAGALVVRFAIPASLALRYELGTAYDGNPGRACAAALGLSSAAIRKHVPYRHQSIGEYGLAVTDWLLAQGVKYAEVQHAGNVAWLHCVHALISESEVKAAADFSGAPASSTS